MDPAAGRGGGWNGRALAAGGPKNRGAGELFADPSRRALLYELLAGRDTRAGVLEHVLPDVLRQLVGRHRSERDGGRRAVDPRAA